MRTQFCFFNLRTCLIYLCCYLLIMVAAGSRVVNGLKCYCNPKECDIIRSHQCPGKGLLLWDPCKCCRICAKTLGETCGGPGEFSGQCEPPLQCVTRLPITTGLGVCMDLPVSLDVTPPTSALLSPSSLSSSSSLSTLKTTYQQKQQKQQQLLLFKQQKQIEKNCTKNETIVSEPGCEISNRRCQCWPQLRFCRNSADLANFGGGIGVGVTSSSPGQTSSPTIRWHFKTMEDCQLNLQNLIKIEMEFDEDYTISPRTYTFKKSHRKRRSLRKRTLKFFVHKDRTTRGTMIKQ